MDLSTLRPISLPANVSQYRGDTFIAWSPDGAELTISQSERHTIVEVDATTLVQRKLVDLPAGDFVDCLSWMADGRHLVLAASGPRSQYCGDPHALYSYLAPPATSLALYKPTAPTPTPAATPSTPTPAVSLTPTPATVPAAAFGAGGLDSS
jgi:hypothetical protein